MIYAMEPLMGVEPTFSAWKADVLPLNYNGAMGVGLEATPCIRLSGSSISEMCECRAFALGLVNGIEPPTF